MFLPSLISAKRIDAEKFTQESYAILAAAIQKAEAAVADPKTAPGKFRQLKTDLLSAINGLVIDENAASAAEVAAACRVFVFLLTSSTDSVIL